MAICFKKGKRVHEYHPTSIQNKVIIGIILGQHPKSSCIHGKKVSCEYSLRSTPSYIRTKRSYISSNSRRVHTYTLKTSRTNTSTYTDTDYRYARNQTKPSYIHVHTRPNQEQDESLVQRDELYSTSRTKLAYTGRNHRTYSTRKQTGHPSTLHERPVRRNHRTYT